MADTIRVLYVDDEPGLLEIGRNFLQAGGEFSVDTALSAKDALGILAKKTYDAIVSDYQMPRMNGIELLKTVRASDKNIPFILFTGRGREEIVIEAINNGADFYLQKGSDFDAQFAELEHKIRQAVIRRRAEHLRTETEKQLHDIIDFLPDATFAIDKAGTVIAWNRAMEEMTGRSTLEMLGKGDYEYAVPFYGTRRPILIDFVFSPSDEVRKKYSFIRTDNRGLTAETVNATPKGKTCILWGRAASLMNSEGEIIGAIESIRDITDAKKAEETLTSSREYLDRVFSSVKAGIMIIDAVTHEILDINPAGADMIGLPKDQIIGNTCHKFVCPAETGRCPITDLHTIVDNTERILLTGDGRKIPIIKYVTRAILNGRECLLETFIDNRERRQVENALRESEEKYRLLTEATDDVLYMVDLEGKIIHISPQISRYGYTPEEVVSRNFTGFLAEEDIPVVMADFEKSLSMKIPLVTQMRIRDKAGNLHWMEDNGAPVTDDSGSVTAISGILRDITGRKNAEEAQKESEEIFRTVFDSSPYPIAINSLPDNKFLRVNQAFRDISEYSDNEILGKDPIEMGFLSVTEALKLISYRVLRGKIENIPLAVTAKGGKRVHVLFSTLPITIRNKPAIVTVTAEVTKLKRIEEELLRKNEDLNAAYEELTATDEEIRQSYDELNKKEMILRTSEEKFRALVELSLDGIIITDFFGKLLFANKAAAMIVDVTDLPSVIGKKNVMDFVSPESKASVLLDFGQVAMGIDAYLVNYKLITATKREVWVECIGKKIPFEGSTAMLVSMRDVTERKQSEERLRESEKKFSTLFRSSPVALTLVSALDGKFVDVSDSFTVNTGYSRDKIIGKTAEELGIFADKKEHEQMTASIRKKRVVDGMEMRCRTISGGIRICRLTSGIIFMNGLPHILSSVEDVTESRKSQEALRESDEKFRSLIETSPDIIWDIDIQGKLQYVSPRIKDVLGYSPEELSGKTITDLIPENSRLNLRQELARHITAEGPFAPIEVPVRHKSGRNLILEIRPSKIIDANGTVVGFRGVGRDITETKRDMEALRQANKKLNLLSGVTRHDIKNQLIALKGFVKLLNKEITDPRYEHYFSRISDAGTQITNMIQFTKEYEEVGVLAPAWQDIRLVVDNAGREVGPGQITIINDLPRNLEIFADPLLAKVVFNLIDNAVRHGGNISRIRFFKEEQNGDCVIICEDDGVGIVAEEKEQIFDLGYGRNTGFGLAISREILDITGITIKETGEPKKGARFEMTIPHGQFRTGQ